MVDTTKKTFILLIGLLLAAGCASPPPIEDEDTAPPEALEVHPLPEKEEQDMVTLNEEHLHFLEDTDPDEALPRIRAAFRWHGAQPRSAGSMNLRTIEELTQNHYVEVTARDRRIDLLIYPATPPILWEVMLTINEADEVENMVTAPLEDAPPPEDFE